MTDSDSDFSGFDTGDFEDSSRSDISVSDVSTVSDVSSSSSDTDVTGAGDAGNPQAAPWSSNLTPVNVPAFTEPTGATFPLPASAAEFDFFEMFFTDGLMTEIVNESNRYASVATGIKPDPYWSPIDTAEFKAFLGLMVTLSVIPLPSHKLAWTTHRVFRHPAFGETMTRTRFEKILKYFHVGNATSNPPRGQPGHDRLSLVRSVMDQILQKCVDNYQPSKECSVDEAMIAYKGRLSFKQYLPAKPTKFGVKVWVRADPNNGYVNEFQVYTGKSDQTSSSEGGLGERVVKKLCERLHGKNHHVYMDNYFSTPKLFTDMERACIYCCGTVRVNRKGLPVELKNKRLLRNQGDFVIFQKGSLTATAWKDKKQVNFLSTNCNPTEIDTVSRRQKDGSRVDVVCPIVSKCYTTYMSGVDRADQLRMQYATCRKAVKWWKYIFWFLFDIAVCNAFICMRESASHQLVSRRGKVKLRTQIDFRIKLAEQLIGDFRSLRKRKSTPTVDLAGFSHWPVLGEKPGRCKRCWSMKVRHEVSIRCEQCQVFLCVDRGCFKAYHVDLLSE